MLPFLQRKSDSASSSEPVDHQLREPDDGEVGIHSAAEDLCNAVHSRDIKAVAAALRAAFELMDEQPHVEGPHLPEDDK